MSWSPLPPPSPKAVAKARVAITATSSAGIGRRPPKFTLSFRPALLDGITWLTVDSSVQVEIGGGEHKGMLRIMPNGLHPLCKVPHRAASGMVALRLPLPPGIAPGKRPAVAVEFDYQDRWIQVTLPDWSEPPAPAAAPAPAAPAKPRSVVMAEQAAEIARRKAAR